MGYQTSIRLDSNTKDRLARMDFIKKGDSYEDIINRLIDYYLENQETTDKRRYK